MIKKATAIIIIIILIITYNNIDNSSAITKDEFAKYQGWERSEILNLKNDEIGIIIEIIEKRLYLIKGNEIIKI